MIVVLAHSCGHGKNDKQDYERNYDEQYRYPGDQAADARHTGVSRLAVFSGGQEQ